MSGRTLVAGVGNIFCGDDGFGPALAERLLHDDVPSSVRVADFGIGATHLAHELLNGYETLVLLDAKDLGEQPGTVVTIDLGAVGPERSPAGGAPRLEAHLMSPEIVVSLVAALGATVPRCLLVACQPACVDPRLGLTPSVEASVGAARRVVHQLLMSLSPTTAEGSHV